MYMLKPHDPQSGEASTNSPRPDYLSALPPLLLLLLVLPADSPRRRSKTQPWPLLSARVAALSPKSLVAPASAPCLCGTQPWSDIGRTAALSAHQ